MVGLARIRRNLSQLILLSSALAGLSASCSSRSSDRPDPPAASTSELSRRFDALHQLDEASVALGEVARFAAIGAEYERSFGPTIRAPLTRLSDADLEAVFRATELITAYVRLPVHAEAQAAVIAELEARGKAEPRHQKRLFQTWLSLRKLDEARALRAKHPEAKLPAVPDLRDGGGAITGQPNVWTVAADATDAAPVLERRSVDLSGAAQVVVIANPFCHFAQAAVAALDADPSLRPVLAAHSSWITPQDGFFAVDETQEWNRAHPGMPIGFSVQRDDWPAIDTWSTPTFYFLQRGALVAKVEGWPKAGRRDEIAAALKKIGLL
jgi:hypothetical protein